MSGRDRTPNFKVIGHRKTRLMHPFPNSRTSGYHTWTVAMIQCQLYVCMEVVLIFWRMLFRIFGIWPWRKEDRSHVSCATSRWWGRRTQGEVFEGWKYNEFLWIRCTPMLSRMLIESIHSLIETIPWTITRQDGAARTIWYYDYGFLFLFLSLVCFLFSVFFSLVICFCFYVRY